MKKSLILFMVFLFAMLPLSSVIACKSEFPSASGLNKIEHFVFIMQENRSFDHYFGTYPGADGIPPGVALQDPVDGTMVAPFHLTGGISFDAPHEWDNAWACINDGKMNGFMIEAYKTYGLSVTPVPGLPGYDPKEVMGYYDYRDIPNYWNYARLYVLQDRMFASSAGFSLVNHLYMLAAQSGGYYGGFPFPETYNFPQITELLASGNITWKYYVTSGASPDEEGRAIGSESEQKENPKEYTLWNPLPAFPKVANDLTQFIFLQDTAEFYKDAQAGHLPEVSWICPFLGNPLSEHPAFKEASVMDGMAYVTGLINAVMQGPDWNSSAIFLCWDDWGGYYDHVVPPRVDEGGFGIRVPGLIISPYSKQGYVDHNTYSFDSWLRLIEERFSIQPMTARDRDALNMIDSFDFTQKPRPPVILSATKEGSSYPQSLQQIRH